jgi:hypothetical protein
MGAMDEFLRNALLRKLAVAEGSGDVIWAARIRARLAKAAPKFEPEPQPPIVEPIVEIEPVPEPEMAVPTAEPAIQMADPVSVGFASLQAEELASQYGLDPDDFDFVQSGKTGFTVADVKRAAGITEEDD